MDKLQRYGMGGKALDHNRSYVLSWDSDEALRKQQERIEAMDECLESLSVYAPDDIALAKLDALQNPKETK